MNKITSMMPFLAVVLLVPPGLVNAQMVPGEEEEITPYALKEIERSFSVMEEYVIYDENKNITFDVANATRNQDVTQSDIDISLDFAIHNNDIMNAAVGAVGQVNELQTDDAELQRALQELEGGKFKALFGKEIDSVDTVNEITFTVHESIPTQIISVFGVYEADIHQTRHHTGSSSLLACGGSMSNPHSWNPAIIYPSRGQDAFDNYNDARMWAFAQGYHLVSAYATDHLHHDFAKTDITAPGDCNSGEFREQAVMIVKNTGTKFNMQHDEPNPELLNYAWPKLWWGPYTFWWHVTDGGTKA